MPRRNSRRADVKINVSTNSSSRPRAKPRKQQKKLAKHSSVSPLSPFPLNRIVDSTLSDQWTPGLHYPCMGHTGGYSRYLGTTRFTLTAQAGGAVSIVANPYLAWTNRFWYERVSSTLGQNSFIPTIAQVGTTGTNPIPSMSSYTEVTLNGQYTTSSTVSYTGWCRPIGMRFRITYMGTDLNAGGQVLAIHNPQQSSLYYQSLAGAADSASFLPTYTTISQLDSASDRVSVHRMGRTFTYVWRPNRPDFRNVSTYLNNDSGSTSTSSYVASAEVNERYIPSTENPGSQVEVGWTCGFSVAPAYTTGLTGGSSNYLVEIDYEADLLVCNQFNTTVGASGYPTYTAQYPSRHNAHAADVYQNALATLHHGRSTHKTAISAENLAIKDAKSIAKNLAKGGLTSVGENLGSALMSMI